MPLGARFVLGAGLPTPPLARPKLAIEDSGGDASIGGTSEVVDVSQPRLLEVIPMSKKAYRATYVNDVNWDQLVRGREGVDISLGVDVGKFDLWPVCRWADGRFERPWRVKNPREIPTLLALVKRMSVGRT